MIQLSINPTLAETVALGFDGFIGNQPAVQTLSRSLVLALGRDPVYLDKNFLFTGPRSTGKTELATRVANVLGVPFLRLDGKSCSNREQLIASVAEMLAGHEQYPHRADGEARGLPIMDYPAFALLVDECHLMGESMLGGLLTGLESADRSITTGKGNRHIARMRKATFLFATTDKVRLGAAFRSRFLEIPLEKYTRDQVREMVSNAYPHLTADILDLIVGCSRCVPRIAKMLAREVVEEVSARGGEYLDAVRNVMYSSGIISRNGATKSDLAYLRFLDSQKRPVGERMIKMSLPDLAADEIATDIEPFLLEGGCIKREANGRVITRAGEDFVKRVGAAMAEAGVA